MRQPSLACQVEGCAAMLHDCKPYFKRQKICEDHAKADSIPDGRGGYVRFCQQCTKLEPLTLFEGAKRSCRASLLKRHNRRRRRRSSRSNEDSQQRPSSSSTISDGDGQASDPVEKPPGLGRSRLQPLADGSPCSANSQQPSCSVSPSPNPTPLSAAAPANPNATAATELRPASKRPCLEGAAVAVAPAPAAPAPAFTQLPQASLNDLEAGAPGWRQMPQAVPTGTGLAPPPSPTHNIHSAFLTASMLAQAAVTTAAAPAPAIANASSQHLQNLGSLASAFTPVASLELSMPSGALPQSLGANGQLAHNPPGLNSLLEALQLLQQLQTLIGSAVAAQLQQHLGSCDAARENSTLQQPHMKSQLGMLPPTSQAPQLDPLQLLHHQATALLRQPAEPAAPQPHFPHSLLLQQLQPSSTSQDNSDQPVSRSLQMLQSTLAQLASAQGQGGNPHSHPARKQQQASQPAARVAEPSGVKFNGCNTQADDTTAAMCLKAVAGARAGRGSDDLLSRLADALAGQAAQR